MSHLLDVPATLRRAQPDAGAKTQSQLGRFGTTLMIDFGVARRPIMKGAGEIVVLSVAVTTLVA